MTILTQHDIDQILRNREHVSDGTVRAIEAAVLAKIQVIRDSRITESNPVELHQIKTACLEGVAFGESLSAQEKKK